MASEPATASVSRSQRLALNAAVGEVAVEADRHAEAGDEVEGDRETDVDPAEAPAPGDRRRRRAGQERDDHDHVQQGLLDRALALVGHRLRAARWRGYGSRHGSSRSGCGAEGVLGCRPVVVSFYPGYATVTYGSVTCDAPHPGRSRVRAAARTALARLGAVVAVGDGVIGSPPAFGAVQSRFESESPSQAPRMPPADRRRARTPLGLAGKLVPSRREEPAVTDAHPTAVVVLAAGEGTRMRSATPKVLHEIGRAHARRPRAGRGRPARARTRTLVVVGAGREAVAAHLGQIAPGRGAGRAGRAARHRARRPGRAGGGAGRRRAPCWCCPATPRCCAPRRCAGWSRSTRAAAPSRPCSPPWCPTRPATAGCCAGPAARSPRSSSTATRPTSSGPSTRSTRACTRSSPARCGTRWPGCPPRTRRARNTSPTSSACSSRPGSPVGALVADGRPRPPG